MMSIPSLDISGLFDHAAKDARAELARAFAAAYGQTGFAYVTGHGIDPVLLDQVFDAAKAFHALPMAAKMAVALDRNHRGYIPINTSTDVNSTLADVTRPNQSASFMMMREDAHAEPGIYLSGPNQWPDLPRFRKTLETYSAKMTMLGRAMMALAVEAVGAKPDTILPAFDTPTIWLRLLHYPPQPPQSPDDLYGSAPHTDFGCLTFLAQDQVGGLEVMAPDGTWLAAPYREGAFIVNVGDMLHRLSNGGLRSTPHRVINRSGRERYSVPFFFDPHVSTTIAPLPGTGDPVFQPVRFDDFLRAELTAGYDAHKGSDTTDP